MNLLQVQTLSSVLGLAVLASTATAQTVCTQSSDNMTINNGGVACVTQGPPQLSAGTNFLRRYPAGSCAIPAGSFITGVRFGAQIALAGNGALMQPANVRIYSIAPAAPFVYANMTSLRDKAIMIPDGNMQFISETFASPLTAPAGQDLVIELVIPSGVATMDLYFPGSNGLGQTAPSYISSTGCGIAEPTDFSAINFPLVHLILDIEIGTGPATIGTTYCNPAVSNTSGMPAAITAAGSAVAASNNLTLTAAMMPANQFGFFLTSQTQGLVMNPGGSDGNLCLGGVIGRYVGAGLIMNSGAGGTFSLPLNLAQTPAGPVFVSIVAGQTWNFQAWFRDLAPGGGPQSNFTNGLSVTFQ